MRIEQGNYYLRQRTEKILFGYGVIINDASSRTGAFFLHYIKENRRRTPRNADLPCSWGFVSVYK